MLRKTIAPGKNLTSGPGGGTSCVVLYADATRGTLWGVPASGAANVLKATLYKSTDNGITWAEVKAFGTRNQTVLGVASGDTWYDLVHSVIVIHGATEAEDTIAVCTSNNPTTYDGVIRVSHDNGTTWALAKFADDQDMGTGVDFWLAIGVGFPGWTIDTNESYSVIGPYQKKDATGATVRDIWKSNDNFDTWSRIWYQPGDASVDATSLHCHMTRIDPDGGCWLSFGDHESGWDHANVTLGMWHSPGEPAAIVGLPAAQDFGSFRRIYSATSEESRLSDGVWHRVRPVNGIFKAAPGTNLAPYGKMNVDTDANGVVDGFTSFPVTPEYTTTVDFVDGGQQLAVTGVASAANKISYIWHTDKFTLSPSTVHSMRALYKCAATTNGNYDILLQEYNAGGTGIQNTFIFQARTAAQANYTEQQKLNFTTHADTVNARLIMRFKSAAAGAVAGSITVKNFWINEGATLSGCEQYFYVGEDSMTTGEARTITRIRFDDGTYLPAIKLDQTSAADGAYNGGIFNMVEVNENLWLAFAVSEVVQGGTSTQAMFVTRDGGETWYYQDSYSLAGNPVSMCRNLSAQGIWWGGRANSTTLGPGFAPIIQRRLGR